MIDRPTVELQTVSLYLTTSFVRTAVEFLLAVVMATGQLYLLPLNGMARPPSSARRDGIRLTSQCSHDSPLDRPLRNPRGDRDERASSKHVKNSGDPWGQQPGLQ